MNGQQWHGVWVGLGTAAVWIGATFLGAALLIRTSDELTAMKARREVRRADVHLARSRDCCAAHGLDVYGGDE